MSERRKCNDPDCDFPMCQCWQMKERFSQGRVLKLESALDLAKEMFMANGLDLPYTFEVIDEALKYE